MSYDASDWIWDHASELPTTSSGEYLVLLALAKRCSPEFRYAWPSMPDIARLTKLDVETVRHHIRSLQDKGIILVETGGGNKTNHYFIVGWSEVVPATAKVVADTAYTPLTDGGAVMHTPPQSVGGHPPDPSGDTPLTDGGTPPPPIREEYKEKENLKRKEMESSSPRAPARKDDDNPDIWQALYNGACSVFDKPKLTNKQMQIVAGIHDRLVSQGLSPPEVVALIERATSKTAANGGNLTYWERVIEGEVKKLLAPSDGEEIVVDGVTIILPNQKGANVNGSGKEQRQQPQQFRTSTEKAHDNLRDTFANRKARHT